MRRDGWCTRGSALRSEGLGGKMRGEARSQRHIGCGGRSQEVGPMSAAHPIFPSTIPVWEALGEQAWEELAQQGFSQDEEFAMVVIRSHVRGHEGDDGSGCINAMGVACVSLRQAEVAMGLSSSSWMDRSENVSKRLAKSILPLSWALQAVLGSEDDFAPTHATGWVDGFSDDQDGKLCVVISLTFSTTLEACAGVDPTPSRDKLAELAMRKGQELSSLLGPGALWVPYAGEEFDEAMGREIRRRAHAAREAALISKGMSNPGPSVRKLGL